MMEDPRHPFGTNSTASSINRQAASAGTGNHLEQHHVVETANNSSLLYYDLPATNFIYSPPSDFAVTRPPLAEMLPIESDEVTTARGKPEDTATMTASGGRNVFRNKCLSFLALVAGLAALSCSVVALAGTTAWVDTWEPIDLPPTSEWSTLFGTGYGAIFPGKSNSKNKLMTGYSAGGKSAGHAAVQHSPPTTTSSTTTTTTTAPPTTTAKSVVTTAVNRVGSTSTQDPDYEDEDEYYALDQPLMAETAYHREDDSALTDLMLHPESIQHDQEEEEDDEPRRSLMVVFHIGLFRACPVLKGELAPNVVLPNLPCVAVDYVQWRPLSGHNFRLWRNIEFTPDFLNKFRYATPCLCLGTFLSLIAFLVGAGRRCCGGRRRNGPHSSIPDVTLMCSSLNILAGLSLGSGLIIFVSVLHDEFSLPLTSASSSASSAARTIGVGGGSWAVSSWQSAAFFNPGGATLPGPAGMTSSYGHQQPLVLLPSFRYGWAFYAALAAFVGSELAAALYILLHTRLFKWTTATKRTAQLSGQKLIGSSPVHRSRSKEAAVQTSPLSSSATLVPVMLDARQGRAITTDSHIRQHHTPYCDLLALTVASDVDTSVMSVTGSPASSISSHRPTSMYAATNNTSPAPPGTGNGADCTCSHYATYRPRAMQRNAVAGIHKASTMPRKQVGFVPSGAVTAVAAEEEAVLASVYQQTPL